MIDFKFHYNIYDSLEKWRTNNFDDLMLFFNICRPLRFANLIEEQLMPSIRERVYHD